MLIGYMTVCMCSVCVWLRVAPFCVDCCPGTPSTGLWKTIIPFLCPWPGCAQEDWHFLSADTDSSLYTRRCLKEVTKELGRIIMFMYVYWYCTPLFVRSKNTNHYSSIKYIPTVSTRIHKCPLCHATMAGKVQLSEKETRWEGKSLTLNVNGEDNMRCASCPHPCNWGDHSAHNQWGGGRDGG